MYVTDALKIIAENTAVPAAGFTGGEAGMTVTRRWVENDAPPPETETRTAEEIIRHIREKLEEV